MKKVYIAVINDLVSDQRVKRVAGMLFKEGLEVHAIGRVTNATPETEGFPFHVRRFRMLFRMGPFFYVFFNVRLFLHLMSRSRPGLFIANDLDTLLASSLASWIRGVPLVFDSHEYFTEVPELIGRHRVQAFWKRLERHLLPRLKYCITVSPSLAELYKKEYDRDFAVVRNVPALLELPEGLEKLKEPTLIYQGALNLGRGIELMIDSMKHLEGTRLLLAGAGDVEAELKRQVRAAGLEARVAFLGRIHPEELRKLTPRCSLGLSLEEDMGLNYRFALPNKIFDYMQARIPVICSGLPEMSGLVSGYKTGEILEDRKPEVLASLVSRVLDRLDRGAYRENLDKAAAELNWEHESGIYLKVVRKALDS